MTTAMVIRGPMGGDHYTPVHNWILRGGLRPEYVGVYAYVASHREGWRLTEVQIAKEIGKGRSYVRAALQAMEDAQLLVRQRVRNTDGTLAGALWWVSDLAAQLRHLGVDENTIQRRVTDEAERCFRRSAPMSENRTLAVTRQNDPPAEDQERLPRSEPKSGYPTLGNRTTKEEQAFKKSKISPPPTSSSPPAPAVDADVQEEEVVMGTDPTTHNQEPQTRESAAGDDLVSEAVQVVDAAPWPAGQEPGPTNRAKLALAAEQCLSAGHPTSDVSRELAEAMTANTPVGAMLTRLERLAALPPAKPAVARPVSAQPEWCGQCTSPTRRIVETDPDRPHRCPRCHPDQVATQRASTGTGVAA